MRSALLFLLSLTSLRGAAVTLDPLIIIPHMADGGSWKTTLKFVNLGIHNVVLNVTFLGDDGKEIHYPLVPNADFKDATQIFTPITIVLTIAPGQTSTIETAGIADNLLSGWGEAFQMQTNCCPEPMGALAIYTQHNPGGQDQEAAVPLAGNGSGTFSLLFDNTAYVTGMAIVNQNDAAVPVVAHIRDRTGKEIDQQTIILAKYGHLAAAVPDLLRSTANTAGSILFVPATSGITAFGLRFNGSAFTTFNAFPASP